MSKNELSSNWAALKSKIKPEKSVKRITKSTIKSEVKKNTNLKKKIIKRVDTEETIIQEAVMDSPTFSLIPQGAESRRTEIGKYLAMDCEFVGVGPEGKESALARVSIVNFYGHIVFDSFVKPKERVVDWRTWVSGVTPKHMKEAITFEEAQNKTAELLKNRILVGHAIQHDLDALFLSHPKYLIRDTSKHAPFRKLSNGKTPGLKKLTKEILNMDIQGAEHSSVEDARATMLLYRQHKNEFEKSLRKFNTAAT